MTTQISTMQRQLLAQLLKWKDKARRKPLLIDGARQTGKTWLLKNLLGAEFDQVLHLDFLANPGLAEAFADSLNPQTLIASIELMTGQTFNPRSDLLILDEIGECPRAVTSLKYFAEQSPDWHVAASGSNIGLLDSFPVGQVEQHNLKPLTFAEFIQASGDAALINAFETQADTAAAHSRLMDQLTDYYFTGGMPEAVACWFGKSVDSGIASVATDDHVDGTSNKSAIAGVSLEEVSGVEKVSKGSVNATVDGSATNAGPGILARVESVRQIQQNLLEGYRRDFGKYAGKVDAQLIEAVFNSIPAQLSAVIDGSVNRFRFKGVAPRKSRYADFESAINWLHKSRLALKNYPLEGALNSPLAGYRKENMLKLFMFDVGLLNAMLGSGYQEIKQQGYQYKGFVAENFVQQELAALGLEPSYSWQSARAEIEFVFSNANGQVIPVEVKSGSRTRAKSLRTYMQKYQPSKSFKLTGTRGSSAHIDHAAANAAANANSSPYSLTPTVLPLYYAKYLPAMW